MTPAVDDARCLSLPEMMVIEGAVYFAILLRDAGCAAQHRGGAAVMDDERDLIDATGVELELPSNVERTPTVGA